MHGVDVRTYSRVFGPKEKMSAQRRESGSFADLLKGLASRPIPWQQRGGQPESNENKSEEVKALRSAGTWSASLKGKFTGD